MNEKFAPAFEHIQKIGVRAVGFLQNIGDLCWFAVAIVEEIIYDLRRGKAPFRRHLFFDQTVRVGVEAVPLVFLVSLFLGLTTALLTGYQLRKYGTEDLIPGLVAVSFTRELGPLLTGIVLAARSGAAFTAELSTMTVSDEVDAIETMGIGAFRYLVVPRVLALLLLFPCLCTVANVAGMSGAAFVSNLELDIRYSHFLDLAMQQLYVKDILVGIIKSVVFGSLIGLISCFKGLTVENGAAGVGLATTSAVVTSIATVIGFDMICNLIVTRVFP